MTTTLLKWELMLTENRVYVHTRPLSINHTAADWSDTNFDTTYKAKLIPQLLPTLIIAGEHDQIIPLTVYSSKKEYHRNNIFIQSISQAGHFPWFDNPEETLQVILNFTAGLN